MKNKFDYSDCFKIEKAIPVIIPKQNKLFLKIFRVICANDKILYSFDESYEIKYFTKAGIIKSACRDISIKNLNEFHKTTGTTPVEKSSYTEYYMYILDTGSDYNTVSDRFFNKVRKILKKNEEQYYKKLRL